MFKFRKIINKKCFFFISNWFSAIPIQKFDFIISNPPYISKIEFMQLSREVMFEPKDALVSRFRGFMDIYLIVKKSRKYLINNGWLILEHGWLQGKVVRKIFSNYFYNNIKTFKDYNGNDRVTIGQWNYDERNRKF